MNQNTTPSGLLDEFSRFLTQQTGYVHLPTIAINLLIGAGLALLLAQIYIYFGRSPSDRRAFASQFLLVTMTTTVIISVVKSSLALSLGLVGALSIVRFRSAVREHEELAYLFLAIGIGLCLGADQRALALVAFGVISVFLVGRGLLRPRVRHENLYLKINGPLPEESALETITEILAARCNMVKLKRYDVIEGVMETSFLVEFRDIGDLAAAQNALRERLSPTTISVIDSEGIA